MNREKFIEILIGKMHSLLLYEAYLEFKKEEAETMGNSQFAFYFNAWSLSNSVNVQELAKSVSDYYCLKFSITKVFDKNKRLIKIF